MSKALRQIITIDEDKCDGCGNCVPACVEGALQVIAGKARLVKESYCDGLGACLGDCPQGALHVTTLEVEAYDEPGVLDHLQRTAPERVEHHVAHLREHGMQSSYTPAAKTHPESIPLCPSLQVRAWDNGAAATPATHRRRTTGADEDEPTQVRVKSELRQWPVQLHLVPVQAPFYHDSDLTLVADCVPFANPDMHADFLHNSAVAVGCPKLDDGQAYIGKLTEILQHNDIRRLKVVYMEVPCCRGLIFIAQQALRQSGKAITLETVLVAVNE